MKYFLFFIVLGIGYAFGRWGIFEPQKEIEQLAPSHDSASQQTTIASTQKMAQYLAQANPESLPKVSGSNSSAPPSAVSQTPFSSDYIDIIPSEKARQLLKSFTPEKAPEIASEMDDLLKNMDPNDAEGRLKPLEVRKWLSENYPDSQASESFLKVADTYFESVLPRGNELGQMAFRYYLDAEKDPETRNRKYKDFMESHGVHVMEPGPDAAPPIVQPVDVAPPPVEVAPDSPPSQIE